MKKKDKIVGYESFYVTFAVVKVCINSVKTIKNYIFKMKKFYLQPDVQVYAMRTENVIATTIPKDDTNPIDDDNKESFDFAPKQDNDWTNN